MHARPVGANCVNISSEGGVKVVGYSQNYINTSKMPK